MVLRLGVVGLGRWGRNHVRVAKELEWEGVSKLVAVCDIEPSRAREVAQRFSVPNFYTDPEEMMRREQLDAVTIAVPIGSLAKVARIAAEYGVSFLVEKPVAESSAVAEELAQVSEARGVVAVPGFIMRFNPAIEALKRIVEESEPVYAVFKRLSRRPPWARRYHIVLDLTIHDIDLVRHLFGDVARVRWSEVQRVRDDDVVIALLEAGRALALVHTDGISLAKVREVDVVTTEFFVRINTDDLEVSLRRSGRVERIYVRGEEPLKKEVRSFLEAVKGSVPPGVPSLRDAVEALKIAETILSRG